MCFKRVNTNIKNAKFRIRQSQVCYLVRTTIPLPVNQLPAAILLTHCVAKDLISREGNARTKNIKTFKEGSFWSEQYARRHIAIIVRVPGGGGT